MSSVGICSCCGFRRGIVWILIRVSVQIPQRRGGFSFSLIFLVKKVLDLVCFLGRIKSTWKPFFSPICIGNVLQTTHHLSINLSPASACINFPHVSPYAVPFFISLQQLPALCDSCVLVQQAVIFNLRVLLCSFGQDSLYCDFLSFCVLELISNSFSANQTFTQF